MQLSSISLFLALAALRVDAAAIDYSLSKRLSTTGQHGASYSLATSFAGSSFFDGFNTFHGQDPTNGFVQYVDMQTGLSAGLAGLVHNDSSANNLAYIGVDATNLAPNGRKSMRLESKYTVSQGSVVVADIHHMPTGCGTWPALWMLGGGEWPAAGEIDILEAVNDDDFNHITLHTSAGLNVQNNKQLFQGKLTNTNCNAGKGSDGCSVMADSVVRGMATAGKAFNAQGGGVYATVWDDAGIRVYLFPRNNLPADLKVGKPTPSSWNSAYALANFQADPSMFARHFDQMRIIVNTDLCGSWAGSPSAWESCAPSTNVKTCNDYVANHPQAFKEAYWLFDGIQVFTATAAAV